MTRYAEKEELVPVWRGVYQRRLVFTGKIRSCHPRDDMVYLPYQVNRSTHAECLYDSGGPNLLG